MGNWEKEFALKLELVCAWRRDWEVWNRRGCWRLAVELGTGRMLLERQEASPVAHIRGCLYVSVRDFGIKGGIRINFQQLTALHFPPISLVFYLKFLLTLL